VEITFGPKQKRINSEGEKKTRKMVVVHQVEKQESFEIQRPS